MKPLIRYWTQALQDDCVAESPVERNRDRDRRTLWLLVGYCVLGAAVVAVIVGLAPLAPTLVWTWRAGR